MNKMLNTYLENQICSIKLYNSCSNPVKNVFSVLSCGAGWDQEQPMRVGYTESPSSAGL